MVQEGKQGGQGARVLWRRDYETECRLRGTCVFNIDGKFQRHA